MSGPTGVEVLAVGMGSTTNWSLPDGPALAVSRTGMCCPSTASLPVNRSGGRMWFVWVCWLIGTECGVNAVESARFCRNAV